MTKNRTPTPVYLDPGMHPGLGVKGLTRSKSAPDYIGFRYIHTGEIGSEKYDTFCDLVPTLY